MKKILFVLWALMCVSAGLRAQRAVNLNGGTADFSPNLLRRTASEDVPAEFAKGAKAARRFYINPVLQRAGSVRRGDAVDLQLFDGAAYRAVVSDEVADVNGVLTLTLRLPEYPMACALISTGREAKSLVNVSIPELGRSFTSFCAADGDAAYLTEIDREQEIRLECEEAEPAPEAVAVGAGAAPDGLSLRAGCEAVGSAGASASISVLVVYTAAAASSSYATSRGGINNIISTMIALGNTCFSNSGAGVSLSLAGAQQVNYSESGISASLSRLKDAGDGYMDDVHAWRKSLKADLVQLITTDGGSAGIAYVMNNSSKGNVDAGFSVVNVTQVGGSYPCSVHEIGHCLGLGHGALQTANKAGGIYPYSYGWSWIGATENEAGTYKYCSVMSYFGAENYADGIRGVNVPYFSSPDVICDGQPAGSAGVADAARSVNETKHLVACYSDILGRRTAAPAGFRIKSVSCNGVSAEWNAVAGASSYRFYFKEAGAPYWSYYPDLTGAAFSMDYAGVFKTGVEYTCYAAAVNACGEAGDVSAVATFTPACPSSVTSVTVAPASATVAKGDTRQFAATVNGSGSPAQTVTWSVDGGAASTISAAGLLAVDAAETAATLTVRAVAAADPARYGTATVTVTAAPVRYTLALSPNIAARGSVSGGGTFAGGASVTATATPKTGYYFTEWTENGTQVSASAEYSFALSADRTLTAHFEPVIYSITYVLNGGSVGASSGGYTVESARITLPEPAREGYVFRGWYTSADFSGVSVSVIPAGSTGDRTFHAKWEAELRLSDDVEMIPAYHPSIFNYTASVPHEKTSISLITRNGAVLGPYPLQIGENIITYTETATGAMHTRAEVRYTIVVTRSAGDTRNAAIAGNGIRVYTRGSTLNVSAAAAIRSVEIYAVTGSLIRRQEPGSAETAVHNLQRGIYIARIVLENEQAGLIKVIVN